MTKYDFLPIDKLPGIPELPDPFLKSDGSRMASVDEWGERRRRYLIFREYPKKTLCTFVTEVMNFRGVTG